MKEEWKKIEGKPVRIDVGSTYDEAMGESMPSEMLCFTTDNRIVLNGEEFPKTAPMLLMYVNERGEEDVRGCPPILADPKEVGEDEVGMFFAKYPLKEVTSALLKGRMVVGCVKTTNEEGEEEYGYYALRMEEVRYKSVGGEMYETLTLRYNKDGRAYRVRISEKEGGEVKMEREVGVDIFRINQLLTLVE